MFGIPHSLSNSFLFSLALVGLALPAARANQRTHGRSTLSAELRSAWALGDEAWVRQVARDFAAAANPLQWALRERERAIAAGMVALLDGRHADDEAQPTPLTSAGSPQVPV